MSCRKETVLCLYLPYTEVDAKGDYFTRMNSLDNFIFMYMYVCLQTATSCGYVLVLSYSWLWR